MYFVIALQESSSLNHNQANYSIQFDGYIIFYSASAQTLQYQQPLFAFTFNESGNHFVSLRTRYVDGGKWLDLDYITITAEDSGCESITLPLLTQLI